MHLSELISVLGANTDPTRLEDLVEKACLAGKFGPTPFSVVLGHLEQIVDQIQQYELGLRVVGKTPSISVDPSTWICFPHGASVPSVPPAMRKLAAKSIVANQIREALSAMDAFDFEDFCVLYLSRRGYHDCTRRKGNHGIDIEGFLDAPDFRVRVYAQSKCWKVGRNVRGKDVRDFAGALAAEHLRNPRMAMQGIIISTSDFTYGEGSAYDERDLAAVPIELLDGRTLARNTMNMGGGFIELGSDPYVKTDDRYPLQWFD